MALLEQVCGALDAAGVRSALIGAAALAAPGVARSTYDIDLLTTDARSLGEDVWTDVRTGGASVEIRRGDADDPLLGFVRISTAGERDLILLKLHAGGSQDLWDIEQLLALPQAAAVAAQVDADLQVLPLDARQRWSLVRRG